jgi:hypothetical protein
MKLNRLLLASAAVLALVTTSAGAATGQINNIAATM